MLTFRRARYLAIGVLLAANLCLPLMAQTASAAAKAAPPAREMKTVNLATFQLANGNEVRILGVPEVGEVMVGEWVDAGPIERFVLEPKTHPVEVFRRLAPKNSPVPRMIAQLDAKKALAGRKLVEALDQTIQVPMERLGLTAAAAPQAAGAGSCQPGAAGAAFFESHHCNSDGGPGYGKSEAYCFEDSRDWIDKSTGSRRRATYSRMASCGSGMNKFRHFYGTASGWDTQVTVFVDPQKVVRWWSYKKGVKRHRRVRFEEHVAGGWVRGWVKYHSEVADGW